MGFLDHQKDIINRSLLRLGNPEYEEMHESSFSTLYLAYWTPLCRIVSRKRVSLEVAQDLVQDLFLLLWQNKERVFPKLIGDKHELDRWLFYTLWSRSSNYYSREKRHYSLDQEVVSREVMLATATPDIKLEYDLREYEELLEGAIDKLPWHQRVAYNLKQKKQYSMEQIATMMGISVTSAREFYSRANNEIESAMLRRYGFL